jgi:hypothetical protein
MHNILRTCRLAAALATALVAAAPAYAAEELSVIADQSQILRLDRPPGTVVVGNPSIADVTINGNQLFLHGRVFGRTNIIVLDEGGNALAEFDVNVTMVDSYDAVVFKGAEGGILQSTYSCKTECEAALRVGDDKDRFKTVLEQQKTKIGIGQGQKSGEEAASNGQSAPTQ